MHSTTLNGCGATAGQVIDMDGTDEEDGAIRVVDNILQPTVYRPLQS